MTTAVEIITGAMRLFGILDAFEQPTATDIANNSVILNDLLRAENADGATQYLIRMVNATLPQAAGNQNVYTFTIGTAVASYLVQVDAVAVRSIWMNDLNMTVNRETRMAPKADVVRTTQPGIINKWHQERQVDGSVLITAWQPPRAPARALIEYGARLSPITGGASVVDLPPEGIQDAKLLLGRRIYKSYGAAILPTDSILADAERVNKSWRDYARGQQWLRLVRN